MQRPSLPHPEPAAEPAAEPNQQPGRASPPDLPSNTTNEEHAADRDSQHRSDGSLSARTTSQKTPSTGARTSDVPNRRFTSNAAPRPPPNWRQVPGVCNPLELATRTTKSRRLQHIQLLLSEGSLAVGQLVVYKSRAGKVLAEGHIRCLAGAWWSWKNMHLYPVALYPVAHACSVGYVQTLCCGVYAHMCASTNCVSTRNTARAA